MFKVDDIVITPKNAPAVINQVLNNGLDYLVDEMPLIDMWEAAKLIASGVTELPSNEVKYNFVDLKSPTFNDIELQKDIFKNLFKSGYTLPIIN